MCDSMTIVRYEDFGATGNGITDDLAAIVAAHAYANEHHLPVSATPGARYYIGNAPAGAIVKTSTDWTGATFIIDDRFPDLYRNMAVFEVLADKEEYTLENLGPLPRSSTNVGFTLPDRSVMWLKDTNTTRYIRYGGDADNGGPQQELIVVDRDGTIDPSAPLIWEYEQITSARVIPMDDAVLTLKGGTFLTVCNNNLEKPGYISRGIRIRRSNVVLDGMIHYTENEGPNGTCYAGILSTQNCANVTVKNCVFTPHLYYRYPIGDRMQGMGTYDITPTRTVNLSFVNCTQSVDIMDSAYWGVIGSNQCKNMVMENCVFSRFDAHQGVANVTIKHCRLGHQGAESIGFGTLLMEDTVICGPSIIALRPDYGSSWEGDAIIRNCTFIPRRRPFSSITLITCHHDPYHYYGYECYMPRTITFENLHIVDEGATEEYSGPALLQDPTKAWISDEAEAKILADGGRLYHVAEKIRISGITVDSGKDWKLSTNLYPYRNTEIIIEK